MCINNNPAVILVYGASVYGMNDVTHLGLYDIGMMGNIPNLVYLAPACKEEYLQMLHWGINQQDHPVAIRVPAVPVMECGVNDETDYSQLNQFQVAKKGKRAAVLALGDFYSLGQSVVQGLSADHQIEATLINPKYITGIDEELLNDLKKDHQVVITLEDGFLEGGFGEKIARFYGNSDMKVLNYGFKKELLDRYVPQELMKKNGLTQEQMVSDVINLLKVSADQ